MLPIPCGPADYQCDPIEPGSFCPWSLNWPGIYWHYQKARLKTVLRDGWNTGILLGGLGYYCLFVLFGH